MSCCLVATVTEELAEPADPQRLQAVVQLNDGVDGVGDGRDDTVNHVHHAVGGVLVRLDQSSTVDRHDLGRSKLLQRERECVCVRVCEQVLHTPLL